MKHNTSHRSISSLAALLMLLVFAVALLVVLLNGADVYQRLNARDSQSYDSRTCVQYLTTKVRQAQSGEYVEVASFGDGSSLTITEVINGTAFHTQVYCYNGWLMELFTVANAGLLPSDGEKILPAEGLAVYQEEDVLHVFVADVGGESVSVALCLRGGEVS